MRGHAAHVQAQLRSQGADDASSADNWLLVKACIEIISHGRFVKRNLHSHHSIAEFSQVFAAKMAKKAVLDEFLEQFAELVRSRNVEQIRLFLCMNEYINQHFVALLEEIRETHPSDAETTPLRQKLDQYEALQPFPLLKNMVAEWLCFFRDRSDTRLPSTYLYMVDLLVSATAALGNEATAGLVYDAVMNIAHHLSVLTSRIHQDPRLEIQVRVPRTEESLPRVPENTAIHIMKAAQACIRLYKAGKGFPRLEHTFYRLVTIALRTLFRCGHYRKAGEIFETVEAAGIRLRAGMKCDRSMYMYYLGVYYFRQGHMVRTISCLDLAYYSCHRAALINRAVILAPLMAANLILGRFPTDELMSRPEAYNMKEAIGPLREAIIKGDLCAYRMLTEQKCFTRTYLKRMKIINEIQRFGEVLVWRNLARKTFLLFGKDPKNGKHAATFSIEAFHALHYRAERNFLEKTSSSGKRDKNGELVLNVPFDPEFRVLFEGKDDDQSAEDGDDPRDKDYEQQDEAEEDEEDHNEETEKEDLNDLIDADDSTPGGNAPVRKDVVNGKKKNKRSGDDDLFGDDKDEATFEWPEEIKNPKHPNLPSLDGSVSILITLINNGLMRVLISRRKLRVAIQGAKKKPALEAGFPNIWRMLTEESTKNGVKVPGWIPPWIGPGQ